MEIKKGYKNTEIGVIPEKWEVKTLGEVCVYQNGTSLERYFNSKNGFKVISIGNYSPDGKFVENKSYIDKKHKSKINKYLLRKNELTMILNDKTSVGTIIGRVLLIDKNNEYVFNQRTMRLSPKEIVSPLFLYFLINSDFIHNKIIKLAKPGTQIYVNTNDITELKIPYPKSIQEQTAIATVLSDTDNLIQALEKKIAKKQLIKKGAMQKLLSPKEDWVVKTLGEIFQITAGGDLRTNEFSEIKTSEFPFPIFSNAQTNLGLYGFGKTYDYEENAITISARGGIGYTVSRFEKFVAIGRLLVLKPLIEIDCKFIEEFVNINIKFSSESTGVPQLTAPQVSKYKISFPTIQEQTRIATILSDMDKEIETLEKKLAKYKQIKQGLMQVLLTGKIRLV